MMAGSLLSVQADRLIDLDSYGGILRQRQLSSSSYTWQWETAVQSLAEDRTRQWTIVAGPTKKGRVSTKVAAARGAVARRPAVQSAEQASVPGAKDYSWLAVSGLLYTAPALAALLLLLAARAAFFKAAAAWCWAEGAFAVYRFFEHRRVSGLLIDNPSPDVATASELLDRVLRLRGQVDAQGFVSGWFLNAPVSAIRRENMHEFLAYALLHRNYGELSEEKREAVRGFVRKVETEWGLRFGEGFEPSVKFMAHTREPLRTFHHPLAMYAWAHFVSVGTSVALSAMGFTQHTSADGSLHYWLRPGAPHRQGAGEGGEPAPPRVFVHGLGVGITPYLSFISLLMADNSGVSVVVELPHIAMRIWRGTIPTINVLAAAIEQIHHKHGLGPALYVGHSYGTFIVAHLQRTRPHLIGALGLVDPVCFLLCLPDVVYNFCYRPPGGKTLAAALSDTLRWLFCSKELQVAQALCRGFDWHVLHLWADDLPAQRAVMLAGNDRIVPSPQVKRYLEDNHVSVIYNEDFSHAEFLFRPSSQRKFLQALAAACTKAAT